MRDKVENLQKQTRELLSMFYEDTGMLPQINIETKLVELDGQQFVTNIKIRLE